MRHFPVLLLLEPIVSQCQTGAESFKERSQGLADNLPVVSSSPWGCMPESIEEERTPLAPRQCFSYPP